MEREGEAHTFLNLSLLHLVRERLLQVALVVVGELGDVDLGLLLLG